MSLFAGQAFWVVGSNEDKKSNIEQIIRDHGGIISPAIQLASRVIFHEPTEMNKDQIADIFKAFEEANEMNDLSGNCLSLAEYWITASIIERKMISVDMYLVKKEELCNMAFWMNIGGNINKDSKAKVSSALDSLQEKDKNDYTTPGSLDKVVIDLTSDEKPVNDLTAIQDKAVFEEQEIGDQIVVTLGPRKYKASRSDFQASFDEDGGEIIPSSITASNVSSRSSSSLTSLSDSDSEFDNDDHGNVKKHLSQAQKAKAPKSTKRYADQKTVQPQDQEAFNALVKDLKYRVKHGFPGKTGGMQRYLSDQKVMWLYVKYRSLAREQVPQLPRKGDGGPGNSWRAYIDRMNKLARE